MVYLNYFSGSTNDLSFNTDGSAMNPAAFQQHFRRDSNLMGQLFQVNWLFFITKFSHLYQDFKFLCLINFLKQIPSLLISCLYVNVIQFQITWYDLIRFSHFQCLLVIWFWYWLYYDPIYNETYRMIRS